MGQKELKLRFDVSQYTPEEIMVKTVDNKLLVTLKIRLYYGYYKTIYKGIYLTMSKPIAIIFKCFIGSRKTRRKYRWKFGV